jgi:hypothetical protein
MSYRPQHVLLHQLHASYTLRFLHTTLRFWHATLRFSPVTIRFLHATIRFLQGTIRFLHATLHFLHVSNTFWSQSKIAWKWLKPEMNHVTHRANSILQKPSPHSGMHWLRFFVRACIDSHPRIRAYMGRGGKQVRFVSFRKWFYVIA